MNDNFADLEPDAKASAAYEKTGLKSFVIKLSAAGSKQCNSYSWEKVKYVVKY